MLNRLLGFGCAWLVASILVVPATAMETVPKHIDPGLVTSTVPLDGLARLRFVTTLDYPPFNFADENKKPTGFNVELARAICERLDIEAKCEIQAVPWEELEPALEARRAEAVIAGYDITPSFRARFELSQPYFRFPARFMVRQGSVVGPQGSAGLADFVGSPIRVGVLEGSAHAAYVATHFPDANLVRFPDTAPLYNALSSGEVDYLFGDGISFSFWLASNASQDCCQFTAEPILDDRYFGRGMVIALRLDDEVLREAIDAALKELEADGSIEALFVRYFPINPYQKN
ncbi:MAG: transporter substrate-binding domain-containing protein [Pseudomonadota bacterium]